MKYSPGNIPDYVRDKIVFGHFTVTHKRERLLHPYDVLSSP